MPPEAIDLASRLLQYSPKLRYSAVSRAKPYTASSIAILSRRIYH